MVDKKEFRKVMVILFQSYSQTIDVELSDIYYTILKRNDIETIRKAALNHVKSSKWFPKISDLVDQMFPIECTEMEARSDILNAILSGKKDLLKYDISRAIVSDMGWFNCGQMTPNELGVAIHYRYEDVKDHWTACKSQDREFILPGTKDGSRLKNGSTQSIGECLTMSSSNDMNRNSSEYSQTALPEGKK